MITDNTYIPRSSKYHPRFSIRRVLAELSVRGGASTQRLAQSLGMSTVEVGWCLCRLQEIGLVVFCGGSELWTFKDERSLDLF